MRISTNQINDQAVGAMLDTQTKAARTQLQLATGRKILTPADDPAAGASILGLKQAIAVNEQYQKNADTARARLHREESALTGVENLLQRVRELAIQGNNDSQNSQTRRAIASEVRERLSELLATANTMDANGEYLFAGYQRHTQPFAANPAGGYSYFGDQGQRFLEIGPDRQMADGDPGADVFQLIGNGNGTFTTLDNPANTGNGVIDPGTVGGTFVPDTYTITFTQALPTDPITYAVTGAVSGVVVAAGTPYSSGAQINFNGVSLNVTGAPANADSFTVTSSTNQDLFTTVENLATALETGASGTAGHAQFHNAINRFLVDLDQAQTNIEDVRARIGGRLNAIDSQVDGNDLATLQLRETLSTVEDLDYAEAISRLNLQLLALQAAQQSFVRIQGLSLFNFLG